MSTFFLYNVMNDQLVDSLTEGKVAWNRNWTPKDSTLPYNAFTGNPFTGINALYLNAIAQKEGFESSGWIAFGKLKELGGNPIAEQKGKGMILYRQNVSKNPAKPFWKSRYYRVFNLDQTENLPAEYYAYRKNSGKQVFKSFVSPLVKKLGVKLVHGKQTAYNPQTDTLTVPTEKSLKNKALYESVVARGLILSTIHADRLDRTPDDGLFEALVCEIGAYFLMANAGVVRMESNPDLVQKWKNRMDKKANFIHEATSTAMKAVKYIIGEEEQTQEQVPEAPEENGNISIAF